MAISKEKFEKRAIISGAAYEDRLKLDEIMQEYINSKNGFTIEQVEWIDKRYTVDYIAKNYLFGDCASNKGYIRVGNHYTSFSGCSCGVNHYKEIKLYGITKIKDLLLLEKDDWSFLYNIYDKYKPSKKEMHTVTKTLLEFRQDWEIKLNTMTKEEAREIIVDEIKRLNDGWRPNWNNVNKNKYYIYYDYVEKEFYIKCNAIIQKLPNQLYLKSRKLAQQLIETHGDVYKTMLEVVK